MKYDIQELAKVDESKAYSRNKKDQNIFLHSVRLCCCQVV